MTALVSRAYNTFTRDPLKGTVTKTSTDDKLLDELHYYRAVPPQFAVFFPRLLDWNLLDGSFTLEYYDYPNLGDYLTNRVDQQLHPYDWPLVMQHLRSVLDLWATVQSDAVRPNDAYSMYINKTVREFTKFRDQHVWPGLCTTAELVINDVPHPNFLPLWMTVQPYLQEVVIPAASWSFIHGDFGCCNMLYGNQGTLRFVDPRGSFGSMKGCYGDPRYDVAKLSHSVNGHYEFFNNDLFDVSTDGTKRWTYSVQGPDAVVRTARAAFRHAFYEGPTPFDEKVITTLEGLIFIGACARHYENPARQAALYLTGIERLDRAMTL